MKILCFYGCGTEVDPESRTAWRRVTGWERKSFNTGARRGGSDISMREPTGELACDACMMRVKQGLNPQQGSLM